MTKPTSKWAYDEIIENGSLSRSRARYLSVFTESEIPLTAREATRKVEEIFGKKCEVGSCVVRLSELEQMGFLRSVDTVRCSESGKKVTRWEYTGTRVSRQKQLTKIVCPCCKGCGEIKKEIYVDLAEKELF